MNHDAWGHAWGQTPHVINHAWGLTPGVIASLSHGLDT